MAEHFPGVMNHVADKESRTVRDCCNWMLHLQLFSGEGGTSGSGHVCIPPNTSASTLFQLEIRSSSKSNRCLHSRLKSVLGVCKSPMVSPLTYSGKDSVEESQSGLGGANVENTAIVPPPASIAEQLSTSDPKSFNHPIYPNSHTHPIITSVSFFPRFEEHKRLCPAETLRAYALSFHYNPGDSRVFQSLFYWKTWASYFKHYC